jgi:hypothetical protein
VPFNQFAEAPRRRVEAHLPPVVLRENMAVLLALPVRTIAL